MKTKRKIVYEMWEHANRYGEKFLFATVKDKEGSGTHIETLAYLGKTEEAEKASENTMGIALIERLDEVVRESVRAGLPAEEALKVIRAFPYNWELDSLKGFEK